MFKALREKLTGWFSKKEEIVEAPKKKSSNKREVKKKEKKLKETAEKGEQKDLDHAGEESTFESKAGEVDSNELLEKPSEEIENKEAEEEETKETLEKGLEDIEETLEEKKNEEQSEKRGFFSKLVRSITTSKLNKEDFEEFFLKFEMILLENNVSLEVVDKIKEVLNKSLVGEQFKKSQAKDKILGALKNAIDEVLLEGEDLVEIIKKSNKLPYVILFFGINGSGKTTTMAKLAYKLKENKISCVLAAGDTFRAASIEQLEEHAQRLGLQVIKQDYKSDPAAVAFDAIQYAKKHKIKAVLIDTAGRMYTQGNLMKEMEKIVKVSNPDFKIFVGESITGNDATEQAKMFNETAGIDGIILTKADVDEKAGTILSVGYATGKPILYLGVGQRYGDLQTFKKNQVFKHLGLE